MEPIFDRLNILSKIRQIVGDNSEQKKVKEIMNCYHLKDALIFCIEDGELLLYAASRQIDYKHKDHTNNRAFIFSPTTKWDFAEHGELRHYTVGAILWRKYGNEKQYCLFRRRTHPIGYYTIPAGHLEMGEEPEEAVLREIYEETKLKILSIEYLLQEELRDECRQGADYHLWYLYLCQCDGEPQISEEADIIRWFTREEIINDLKLTKPTGYFLGKVTRNNKFTHVQN